MRRKGFTLVELIIVMTLFAVIVGFGLTIFSSSLGIQQSSYNEYDLQNRIRQTSFKLNDVINTSSAIFTIPRDTFKTQAAAGTLTQGWDYYGVTEDGGEYLLYEYDPVNKKHIKKVLATAGNGFKFRLVFNRPLDSEYDTLNEKFIGYRLEIVEKGKTPAEDKPTGYFIETEVEARNSNQVVHRGTVANPATAIAVRSQSKFQSVDQLAIVHMVFDCSGSMAFDLNGNKNSVRVEDQRITKLITAAQYIIDRYMEESDVDIVLYPFSTTANMIGGEFKPSAYERVAENEGASSTYTGNTIYTKNADVLNNRSYVKNSTTLTDEKKSVFYPIQNMDKAKIFVGGLKAKGGTNVSDAIRRVYQNIVFLDREYGKEVYKKDQLTINHYVIILCDGVPTFTPLLQSQGFIHYNTKPSHYKYFDFNGNYYTIKGGTLNTHEFGGKTYFYRELENEINHHNFNNQNSNDANVIINSIEGETIRFYGNQLRDSGVKKTFVIGFSKKESDNGGIEHIATSCGVNKTNFPDQVIKFSDSNISELDKVFVKIKDIIMKDFWLIKGPDL